MCQQMLPLMSAVPYGFSPWYDAQRIYGSRDFGVIFDVGANVGQTAVDLVRFFPKSQIHCFEPASEPFQELDKRARSWSNVAVHRSALGDQAAVRTMRVAGGADSERNTLAVEAVDAEASEAVSIETLDSFCKRNSVTRLTLLKMDVQGWELHVLRGGRTLLESGGIDFVFTEAAFDTHSKEMTSFADIHREMERTGFVLSGIYDQFRWGNKAEVYFCNVLYSHASIARRGRC
jgi:FkbM family methyltransferase